MKLTDDMQVVLHRCRTMNCINEGQAFSIGVMHSELGGRETAEATLKAMIAVNLLSTSATGTYLLTREGAEAISTAAVGRKNLPQSRSWQARRPPVNKMQ